MIASGDDSTESYYTKLSVVILSVEREVHSARLNYSRIFNYRHGKSCVSTKELNEITSCTPLGTWPQSLEFIGGFVFLCIQDSACGYWASASLIN